LDSHADLKTIGRASCPFYAAFRIVVQTLNNSPRFVLNSRVVQDVHLEILKIGLLSPIFKNKGSKNDAINYRGITFLLVISKVIEAVIRDRIQMKVSRFALINGCYCSCYFFFGYRKD
jgi:hypothetical protein